MYSFCEQFQLAIKGQSILTCYLISLALLNKPAHENIGFEKLQQIISIERTT